MNPAVSYTGDMGEEQGELNVAEARQALERFVVDNDDLLALEERIGRFNIFDALRIARTEIRHSNFLAWLLDPAESHGQGSLFLKAILMDLLKQAPAESRPLSPIELDGEELRGVEIRREWRSIDLLIRCEQPEFVIAIENKVDSGEGKGQLQRYENVVHSEWPHQKPMFVFLTTDGTEPSDDDWLAYSYGDIHRVLDRVRQSNRGAIGGDTAAFLEHYLRLIGSRFMNDPAIDELCQRIYTNHRQALDLIWERVGATGSGLPAKIAALINDQADRWTVLTTTSRDVVLAPKAWREVLPSVGERKMFDPTLWLVCRFGVREDHCHFAFQAWPTSDPELRRRAIERLVQTPREFGLKLFFKSSAVAGQKWTRMCREDVAKWPEDEEPDSEKVVEQVAQKLEEVWTRFAGVPDALRPILEEWKKAQPSKVA
jgi:hypothetical protein